MAVRFLPPPEERAPAARDENENLAEVVQMRSWLRPVTQEPERETAAEEDASAAALPGGDFSGRGFSDASASSENSSADDSSVGDSSYGDPSEAVYEAEQAYAEFPATAVETDLDAAGADDAAVGVEAAGSTGSELAAEAGAGAEAEAEAESELAPETPASAQASATTTHARVTRVNFGSGVRFASDLADADADADAPVSSDDDASQGFEERSPAYDDAVRLLARRARSSGELRDDLLALDHSLLDVSIVIDEFHDSHYLDDIGLARVQCEKLRDAKGASSGQIRRKLRERKLPDSVIDEVLGELDTDEEFALLREAAHKRAEKLKGLDRQTAQRRLMGFLARRGWSGEAVSRAVNEALDGAGAGGRNRGGRGSGSVRFE
ncbi:SOS response regulatory protein OraA/RecX [Leucobacter exalbidus]|uniref:Regulatory protein RecX n=1 Tax=Leucobacter exalbidus TaxID=662960 RepID=A0A940PY77_9MICO|nr:regulatory protein RecX [Leucobacter exalbidus]MBP1327549.1 SOS response regulatory protein OraA/RecX [Leucobacter exalbidus]